MGLPGPQKMKKTSSQQGSKKQHGITGVEDVPSVSALT